MDHTKSFGCESIPLYFYACLVYYYDMNKLSKKKRAKIIQMLVEGSSLRSISRIEDVSINTVSKLLVEAGAACAEYHDKAVRGMRSQHVQLDEIWQFCYAKEQNVPFAKAAPDWSGDAWTWTALDSESKMIVSFVTGDRSMTTALVFLDDLKSRLADRIQLTSDGHGVYLGAVERVFGADVDFAQLVKLYGQPEGETATESRYSPGECTGTKKKRVVGNPDPALISTSYVERHNLTMRMSMRRFTRLTNAFSKKIDNHAAALALYFVFYNFCRIHKTLRMTPAMAAGISNTLHDAEWIVDLIDASAQKPQKPGPKPGTKYGPRNQKSN